MGKGQIHVHVLHETRSRLPADACAAHAGMAASRVSEPHGAYPGRVSAGQATDVVARAIAQRLSETMGQQFFVENRAGAAGIIGSELAAKAPPDGYTLLMSSSGPLAVNPGLYAKLPYDPVKDFAPITLAVTVPLFIVANPSFPPNTVKELIARAKANPARSVMRPAATASPITGDGALQEHCRHQHGARAVQGRAARADRPDGGTGCRHVRNRAGALPHVRSGKLKGIAVGSLKRSSAAPDLPTVAESGVPGFEAVAWIAMVAPAGTPAPVIAILNAEIVKMLNLPDTKERFVALGAEPVGSKPEELGAYMKAEIVKWGAVIRDSGARVDLRSAGSASTSRLRRSIARSHTNEMTSR
jgi:tripartite-type tricarboxylate transporter receptor subunit TctC